MESSKEEEASHRVIRKRWWYCQCLSGGLWKLKIERWEREKNAKQGTNPTICNSFHSLLERRDGWVKSVIREEYVYCIVYMLCGWRRF